MKTLFGQEVLEAWTEKCRCVDLELGAVLGRPLYVCTCRLPNGKVCGAMAAMSPIMYQREEHTAFVCKECAARCDPGENQALPVLRLVRLYAQVWVENRCLAMRSAPMHILIHATKDDTKWGLGHRAPVQVDAMTPARPNQMPMLYCDGFCYNDPESQNIWLYASHVQDVNCGDVR